MEGGRPSVPPLRRRRGKPGRRAESSRPTEWSAGNGRVRTPTPTGIVGEKRRAHNVRPYKRERGNLPPHPPPSGAPSPLGEGLRRTKRDRSGTCLLKHRGETQFRTKFLCLLSFSKKVRGPGSLPGPLTCVCCKGEGEMGDIDFFWVRSYHNRKIRRNRVRIMNFL